MSGRLARLAVRAAARLVPSARRGEWLEEWLGELDALDAARSDSPDAARLPGRFEFVVGAFPHALWTMTERWTMDGVLQDLRYAARLLRRSPGFALVAAFTLAFGIGANASIFSLVNGLLWGAPAGIREPERLVQIARSYETDPRWDNFSWPAMKLIAEEARPLGGVAGYMEDVFVIGGGADVEQLIGQYVTGTYFGVLGVRPHLGRLLAPSDDLEPGAHAVVVLSHELWARRFGSDRSVIGRTVSIGARPYEVVGVAPPGFTGVETVAAAPALWVPTMQVPGWFGELPFDRWGMSWINLVGRLADGVTFEAARASMDIVATRLRAADPVNDDILVLLAEGIGLDPDGRREAERVSLMLLLIAGVVLLLTCTNVANLFLARATARRTEVGLRVALGAGRRRLVRQLVTESLLLALLAAALAAPIVLLAGRFLPLVFPYTLAVSVGADARVLAFLAVVSIGAGLFFGAFPAWAATRRDVSDVLREGASTGGRARMRLRDGLVIAQLALSLGLVTSAALLGRSIVNARAAAPGFDPRGLVAGFVDLGPTGRYDRERGLVFFDRLLGEVERLPGVRSATLANQTPIAGGHTRATVRPAGRDDVEYEAEHIIVAADYFETLGIRMLRGRPLGSLRDEPEHVVVVNEALARMFWPGEDPIGMQFAGDPPLRVVGVAADVQMRSLREAARPAVYHPLGHGYRPLMVLHARGEAGREPSARMIRDAVATVDPELPVGTVITLQDALTDSMGETRTIGYLVTAFAALALLLAAVGLYGIVTYTASQRTREMGIRIALGAGPASVVRLLLRRGVALCVLGVGAGLPISYALGRALHGFLFGVGYRDVATVAAAIAVLLLTSTLAAWLPARRASRLDAVTSLRDP